MPDTERVYGDRWGEVIDRPAAEVIELRWFDSTATMSAIEFQEWLTTFATHVEQCRRPRVLVDATHFRMNPSHMEMAWRDLNIIPRYNGAGVRKFAFYMPEGMPAIGAPPAPEGPANFPTAYFGTRFDALAWLAS